MGIFAFLLFWAFQAAPREAAKPGAVEGRVLNVKSAEPVTKALVLLRRGSEPGTGAYTDSTGKFAFQEVEPGSYMISAERDGFVAVPEAEPIVVTVKPGVAESDVTVKLVQTGAISGRVLDPDGQPVTGAGIRILPARAKKSGPISWAATNDRGEYRAFHIAPGQYRIAASYEPKPRQAEVKFPRPNQETYTTTYYPSALDSRQAAVVDVEPGADLQGFDLRLLRTRAVRVRGRVTGPGGSPAGPIVMISLAPAQPKSGGGPYRSTLLRDPNGGFELGDVVPGRYILAASAGLEQTRLSARRILEVHESDVDGVELTLAAPQKISGSVITPRGRKVPEGLLVLLASREQLHEPQAGGASQVASDGGFTITEVMPGEYDVVIGNLGAGDDLYVSSIRMADHDVLAEGLLVGDAPPGRLDIVFRPNGGSVECVVSGPTQKPVPDAHVVLLPDPPRRRQIALHADCSTDAGGACTLVGITPGEYHAFALAKQTELDFRDPEVMKDLEKYGKPVKAAEGAQQRVDLEAIPELK